MVYRFKPHEARFIEKARVMRFASITREGYPHVVPLCHAFDGQYLYAATDYGTKKLDNIRHNPRVAVIIDEYGEPWGRNKGVMIQGVAELLEGGREFEKAAKLLTKKFKYYEREPYGPIEAGDTPIIKVVPERAVSWGLRQRRRRRG